MKDFFGKIKGMDKAQLSEAVKQAKAFTQTEDGKEMLRKLRSGDMGINKSQQEALMNELSKNPDIAKTVSDILNGKG